MKKFIKSIFIFNILLISLMIFGRSIGNLDELWNYNFARNLVKRKYSICRF